MEKDEITEILDDLIYEVMDDNIRVKNKKMLLLFLEASYILLTDEVIDFVLKWDEEDEKRSSGE